MSYWSSDVCSSDLHRYEPLAVQPPTNPLPVRVDFVVIDALISTDPALHVSRIPEKFGLLGLQKLMRQSLPDTVSELDFQPRNQRCHHAIRCHRNGLKHALDHLLCICFPH